MNIQEPTQSNYMQSSVVPPENRGHKQIRPKDGRTTDNAYLTTFYSSMKICQRTYTFPHSRRTNPRLRMQRYKLYTTWQNKYKKKIKHCLKFGLFVGSNSPKNGLL